MVSGSQEGGGTPPAWLRVTARTDNGAGSNDILNYTVDLNSTGSSRTGYIILSSGRLIQPVEITQSANAIESLTVAPGGTISGGGGPYTVTITGSFDLTPVQARDIANDDILDSGLVPATSSGNSSYILTIPPYTMVNTRTVSFEYQDFTTGLWQVIRTSDQHGFKVTSSHNPAVDILTAGQTFDVYANGTYPTLYLQAVDGQGQVISGTPSNMIYSGSGVTGNGIITIEENRGESRTVTLQWSMDDITWKDISSGFQPKYDYTVSTTHVDNAGINASGETFTGQVVGSFPEIRFRAISGSVSITGEFVIPAGSPSGSVPIVIPNNATNTPR